MLPTMLPVDLRILMVAPQDLGRAAAHWLLEEPVRNAVGYVEVLDRYSAGDVAAFSSALNRPVEVSVTPPSEWHNAHWKLGFSHAAADAYARMTAVIIDAEFRDRKMPNGAAQPSSTTSKR